MAAPRCGSVRGAGSPGRHCAVFMLFSLFLLEVIVFRARVLKTVVLASMGACLSLPAFGNDLSVSPFKGSVLYQTYESRFELLPLLTEPLDAKGNPTVTNVEGAVISRVYKRPDDVTSYELYQSYRATLKDNGFEILLACREKACKSKRNVANIYRQDHPVFKTRKYKVLKQQRSIPTYLTSYANHYLAAKKVTAGQTQYVMLIVSDQKNLYSVDVLSVGNREQGTVSITSEMISDGIASEGKVVLTGIYFDTGKATVTPDSVPALQSIARYLKDNPANSFYVVGHTDDTGGLKTNVALSEGRAKAVVKALGQYGVDASRLSGHGVGPFSPAATNASNKGRGENRRVELVLRIK